jgi:AcrR family transcriptional regulator
VSETRDRFLASTNELFRRQGYNGTSIKQVTDAASATTGSLYHFFPGGKDQLAAAVIASSGAAYEELFVMIGTAAGDPASAVTQFFEGAAAVLEEGDFIDICPIGTIAREVASTNDQLRLATDQVFDSWTTAAAILFEDAGLASDASRELATTVLAALEGGFMLARAKRDAEVLRAIGRSIRRVVDLTLASAG